MMKFGKKFFIPGNAMLEYKLLIICSKDLSLEHKTEGDKKGALIGVYVCRDPWRTLRSDTSYLNLSGSFVENFMY